MVSAQRPDQLQLISKTGLSQGLGRLTFMVEEKSYYQAGVRARWMEERELSLGGGVRSGQGLR